MSGIHRLSAVELHAQVVQGSLSCRDVVEAVLARIDAVEPVINAFAEVDRAGALAAADEADEAMRRGNVPGPLHGVPIGVKDLLDVRGMPTRFGSWLGSDTPVGADACAVQRLRAAGALLIGKTTTPEFAGSVLTESPRHGVTRNPWNPAFTPGGSSGGGAAAVAAGCGPLGLATDGAGSARIPASCCNLYGLKPTLGRVPHPQGPDLFSTFTHVGLLARSLHDLAVMLNVLTGPDAGDPWSIGRQWAPVDAGASGERCRVRYLPRIGNPRVAVAVSALATDAVSHLAGSGLAVSVDDTDHDWGIAVSRTIMRAGMWARHAHRAPAERARMGAGLQAAFEQGACADPAALKQAPLARARLYRLVESLLDETPVLLSPTLSAPPPPADFDPVGHLEIDGHDVGDLRDGWFTYPTPFNLTGHPALSIPIGFTPSGLPVGLQAVARWGDEQRLFNVAATLRERFDPQVPWPAETALTVS